VEAYVSEFSLVTVVDEAVANLKGEFARKGLDLEIALPDDVTLNTDRRRLLQCVLNLLSNAVKYTEKGAVRVTAREVRSGEFGVRSKEKVSELITQGSELYADSIEISVEDTGIGIREEDLPLLFTSFTRLESPLKVKNPGTGLGLYLTKKIAVELLGGSVVARSKPGVGSTFTLNIPKNLSKDI
jgi:two-component system sensor histidine kinase EvgS